VAIVSRTIIIGGGIVGSCTAYFLAGHGDVIVLEKDPSYQYAATTLSAASFRTQYSLPLNVRMSLFGSAFLEAMAERVGLVHRAYLVLASAEGAATLRANRDMQLAEGADVALFEGPQIAARFPWLNAQDLACATLGLKHEGWFDAYSLLRAVRADAIARGARYLHDEAVAIEIATDRATAVRTATGEHMATDHVVIAAGPASGRVAALAGIALPIAPRKRTVFVIPRRSTVPACRWCSTAPACGFVRRAMVSSAASPRRPIPTTIPAVTSIPTCICWRTRSGRCWRIAFRRWSSCGCSVPGPAITTCACSTTTR
jgi:glycine/D-amino acid oxidase-like deaminating enzyme